MPSGPPLTPPTKVPSLVLWVNTTLNRIMTSFSAEASEANITLKQGDTIGVEVHLLTTSGSGAIEEYQMPISGGLTLAIGRIDTPPSSGDFKLSYSSEVTSTLPYNATASQVQDALNLLPSIVAMGGVTVAKNGTLYRVTWNTQCVVPIDLIVQRNTLYPTSSIAISKVTNGSLTANQILQLHIKQTPVANITNFEDQDPSIVYSNQLKDASFNGDVKIFRMQAPIAPKGGSFVISFLDGVSQYSTAPISVNASALEIKSALSSKFNTSWEVTQNGSYSWDISVSRYTISSVSVDSSSVISFSSKYGILNLNTIQVEEMLAGTQSSSAVFEIELESSGSKKTLYQGNCTIINDLIDSDSYSIIEWGDYIPANSVVRYDTSQSLTSLEKLQARTNIGAIDNSAIASLQSKDLDLESRIAQTEANSFDANRIASINANLTLTGTNAVVSNSQLTSALSGYATTNHFHQISNITGLEGELNDKSNISHTHGFAEITGLLSQLNLKVSLSEANSLFAPLIHTHTTFGDIALDNITVLNAGQFGSINVTNLITANEINTQNLKVGSFSNTSTTSEIWGALNILGNGFGESTLRCKKVEATDMIETVKVSASEYYNPLSNVTFSMTDVLQVYQHAPLTGSPQPLTSGHYIEVDFGGSQAQGGSRFRIPCYKIY